MEKPGRQIRMVALGIPDDRPDLLQALGRLAVAHGNLEMAQIMCLKTLKRPTPEQVMERFRRKGAKYIRDQIISRMKKSAIVGDLKERKRAVLDMLTEAECLSRRRNGFIHRFWGRNKMVTGARAVTKAPGKACRLSTSSRS